MNNLEELKERKQHGSFLFHFSVYENNETFPDMPPHWHDEFEILYGMKGKAEIHIVEQAYVLEKNQVIIVPSGVIHYSDSFHKPYRFQAIVFDPTMLSGSLADACKLKYIDPIRDNRIGFNLHVTGQNHWEKSVISYVKNIIRYSDRKPIGYELGIKGALSNIFFELISHTPPKNFAYDKKNTEADRLKNTILYIQSNYTQKITEEDLAGQCFMSVYYFCRFFKKVIGMSPMNYVNHYRIQEAANLLKKNDKSITDIAYAVGFNDASYFSKIFQKYQKCTPTEYRKS